MNRRNVLRCAGGAMFSGMLAAGGASALLQPASALAATPDASDMRRIAFLNTHTGDAFSDVYWAQGNYVPDAMDAIRRVMRDHRTNETHDIDPQLLDQLHALHTLVEAGAPYQIISGYRSPATNAALHARSDGVAVRSLHMDGRAIDIRVQGVELARLRDAALSMNAGGVGYYEASDFIHVDTGRVRRW